MDGDNEVKRAYESILQGDYEQAIRWFEEAIAADPDNPAYHHKCSITCMRSGKWSKALQHAERAAGLAPGEAEYAYHLATVQARSLAAAAEQELAGGAPDLAAVIDQLKLALELDPLLDDGYVLLAAAYGAVGNYRKAAETAREALRLNPQQSEAKRLFAEYNRKRRQAMKRPKG
jgi:tetratricopeptide (TPR) repeat protein